MELYDVELSEIVPFFDSIGRDKDLVMIDAESVMTCKFVAGIRINNELAGLTGIRMRYRFIPNLFIVVKAKYQGMGLGSKLLEKDMSFAHKKYSFLTLATRDTKEYEAALHLYKKHGFKIFHKDGHHIRMYIHFNKKGEIASRLAALVYLAHQLSLTTVRKGAK